MEKLTLEIGGMSCMHCVGAVKKALSALPSVNVEDVKIGSATIDYDPAKVDAAKIKDAVDDAGYEVVGTK